MKISFVIPAHNEEALIGKCLESIERALKNYPCDAEVIVVNNASTDRTVEIAQSFSFARIITENRKGLTFAREAGYRASTGDLIANLDSDTMIPDGWIEKVLVEFKKPGIVALSGPFIYYDLSRFTRVWVWLFYLLGFCVYALNHFVLHTGAMLQGGNFVLRRSALEQIGGFDTSIAFYGEDTDIAKRISKLGTVKWTFGLPILASGRRLREEGILRMGARYALNYLWTTYSGKPYTIEYRDIRH